MTDCEDFEVGGLCSEVWVDAYVCSKNYSQWPDGGAYMDQDNLVVSMYAIFNDELARMKQEQERGSKRN